MARIERKSGKIDLNKIKAGFQTFQRVIPVVVANNSKNHFLKGFRRGGGQTDASKSGWTQRKRSRSRANEGRAVLVQSGDLRADIRVRKTSFGRSVIGTSSATSDYSNVHNEGLRSGRGAGFQMPKREFIGDSVELQKKNEQLILNELKKIKP